MCESVCDVQCEGVSGACPMCGPGSPAGRGPCPGFPPRRCCLPSLQRPALPSVRTVFRKEVALGVNQKLSGIFQSDFIPGPSPCCRRHSGSPENQTAAVGTWCSHAAHRCVQSVDVVPSLSVLPPASVVPRLHGLSSALGRLCPLLPRFGGFSPATVIAFDDFRGRSVFF